MDKISIFVAALVSSLVTVLLLNIGGHLDLEPEPERTCESVAIKQRALEQCLKFRPTCEAVTTQNFVDYYDDKNWSSENCPDSGDGFLSQSTE